MQTVNNHWYQWVQYSISVIIHSEPQPQGRHYHPETNRISANHGFIQQCAHICVYVWGCCWMRMDRQVPVNIAVTHSRKSRLLCCLLVCVCVSVCVELYSSSVDPCKSDIERVLWSLWNRRIKHFSGRDSLFFRHHKPSVKHIAFTAKSLNFNIVF